MDVFLLILRLALAAVFGVAAFAKLFDPAGSEKAFGDFGLPKMLARPMVYVLPAFELGIAGALLFVSSSWFGAIGAASLFLIFTAGMLYQLAKGNAPDCHCFGQIHSEPVGVGSIVRNILLLAPAGFLIVRGQLGQGLSLVHADQDILQFVIGLAVVALLLAAVLFLKNISEQQKQIMRRIELMELVAREGGSVERDDIGHPNEGLPLGALVPDFELPTLDGELVSLASLRSERLPVLFMFVSPTCNPCKALVPSFDKWTEELAGKVKVVLVSEGGPEENREKLGGNDGNLILLQMDREVADMFRAKWTPTAVLMDVNGRVASYAAAGDSAIRELVEKITAESTIQEFAYYTNGNGKSYGDIKIGKSVPEVSMQDLSGRVIDSSHFKGKPTLIAFWSLTCPHCSGMLEDLREWEKSKGTDGPNLVMFSDGDKASHLEFGLDSPIILDKGHKTAEGFGMFGTPSAILVNEEGKFISETVIGAPDIWSLIGKGK